MSQKALESALMGKERDLLRMHPIAVQMLIGSGKLKDIRAIQSKLRRHRYEDNVLRRGGTVS